MPWTKTEPLNALHVRPVVLPRKLEVPTAKRVEQEHLAVFPVKIVKIAWSVNIVQANMKTVLVLTQPRAMIAKAANSCPIKVPPNAWIVFLDNFKTKKENKNAKYVQLILLQPVVKKSVRKECEGRKEDQEKIRGGGAVSFVVVVVDGGVGVARWWWHGGTRVAITPSKKSHGAFY